MVYFAPHHNGAREWQTKKCFWLISFSSFISFCCRDELDEIFARLPPPVATDTPSVATAQSTQACTTSAHPLVAGLNLSALPPVVFPEVKEWSDLLRPPTPPKILFIGRDCPATQSAL